MYQRNLNWPISKPVASSRCVFLLKVQGECVRARGRKQVPAKLGVALLTLTVIWMGELQFTHDCQRCAVLTLPSEGAQYSRLHSKTSYNLSVRACSCRMPAWSWPYPNERTFSNYPKKWAKIVFSENNNWKRLLTRSGRNMKKEGPEVHVDPTHVPDLNQNGVNERAKSVFFEYDIFLSVFTRQHAKYSM